MSDLYLDLRAKIPVVAAKTEIGTSRLQELQDRTEHHKVVNVDGFGNVTVTKR